MTQYEKSLQEDLIKMSYENESLKKEIQKIYKDNSNLRKIVKLQGELL